MQVSIDELIDLQFSCHISYILFHLDSNIEDENHLVFKLIMILVNLEVHYSNLLFLLLILAFILI